MNEKIKEIVVQATSKIKELASNEKKYKEALQALAKIKHDDSAACGHKYYSDVFYDIFEILSLELSNEELDAAIYDIGYLLNGGHQIYKSDRSIDKVSESEELYTYLVDIPVSGEAACSTHE